MALYPNNVLQQVQTFNKSGLGFLQNYACFVSTLNTKFKDFQKIEANLGSTVNLQLPYRFVSNSGLVASWQAIVQRYASLSCDQAANTSYTVTSPQQIFNVDKDGSANQMEEIAEGAMVELATQIEANVALNCASAVPGHSESGPYRYFGDGSTPLNSYQQLAQMVANFRNYGAVKSAAKIYLPDMIYPAIVGTGLNQFAQNRNNEIANSWEVGNFGTPRDSYYRSNLLPIHVAGNLGVNQTTLTLVSTNDSTGQNVTQLTFSGAGASDANAVFAGDLLKFNDNVSNQPNMRYLTFIGHVPSSQPVQVRATTASASSGGTVTINITPALNWAGGATQNLNNPLAAGMQVTILPSHRAGLIVGGDAFYLAMPRLPDQRPFDTSAETDPETGVSMRTTYGSLLGQNQTGFICDCIWGSLVVPEYSSRIIIPLSQA